MPQVLPYLAAYAVEAAGYNAVWQAVAYIATSVAVADYDAEALHRKLRRQRLDALA